MEHFLCERAGNVCVNQRMLMRNDFFLRNVLVCQWFCIVLSYLSRKLNAVSSFTVTSSICIVLKARRRLDKKHWQKNKAVAAIMWLHLLKGKITSATRYSHSKSSAAPSSPLESCRWRWTGIFILHQIYQGRWDITEISKKTEQCGRTGRWIYMRVLPAFWITTLTFSHTRGVSKWHYVQD